MRAKRIKDQVPRQGAAWDEKAAWDKWAEKELARRKIAVWPDEEAILEYCSCPGRREEIRRQWPSADWEGVETEHAESMLRGEEFTRNFAKFREGEIGAASETAGLIGGKHPLED